MNTALTEAAGAPPKTAAKSGVAPHKIVIGAIAALVLVAGTIIGIRHWQFYVAHEETDDAQVEGDISPVLPRVSGYVERVLVVDNQHVDAGQALIEVDPKELDVRVAEAGAALQNSVANEATAQAALEGARASADTAKANVETALVRQRKAASDLVRDTSLFK